MLEQKDLEMISEIVDKVVGNKIEPLDKRMKSMKTKIDAVENRIGAVETKIDAVENRIGVIETKIDAVENRIGVVETKIDAVENRIGVVETKADSLDYSVRDIKLTLENETIKQIKIVAEGHQILNRKLDKALEANNEREILKLRLAHLENEIRQVKDRLAIV